MTHNDEYQEAAREAIERALVYTARTSTNIYPIPETLQTEIASILRTKVAETVEKCAVVAENMIDGTGCRVSPGTIAKAIRALLTKET